MSVPSPIKCKVKNRVGTMVALSPPPYTLLAHQFADPPNEFSNGAQRVSRKSPRLAGCRMVVPIVGNTSRRRKLLNRRRRRSLENERARLRGIEREGEASSLREISLVSKDILARASKLDSPKVQK